MRRTAHTWNVKHPFVWQVFSLLSSAAFVALLWVTVGRTVGIFAAGFFTFGNSLGLLLMVLRHRSTSR
jgi:hypothetical protein